MLTSEFTELLASAGGSKPLQATAIIFGTFILEDAATLLAAMQVAAGAVSLPLALGALYAGIVLGDLGLYGLGLLSASHPWAQRLVPQRRQDIGHDWGPPSRSAAGAGQPLRPGLAAAHLHHAGVPPRSDPGICLSSRWRHPGVDLGAIFCQPEARRINVALSWNLALGRTRCILSANYSGQQARGPLLQ